MSDIFKKTNSKWLAPVSLAILALLAFSNSFPASFIGDDKTIVELNPLVANVDLRLIFTTDYWGQAANSRLFRPLTILSFGLENALWGTNPNLIHATNLTLHALVSVLMYLVFKRFGVDRKVSWLAAALFAVHPIHTEVLNEAVGRAELLVAVMVLTVLLLWPFSKKTCYLLVMVICFLLGLLAKENAIVLLAWLPVITYVFYSDGKNLFTEWGIPYASLVVISLVWIGWRSFGVVRATGPDGYDPVYTPLGFLSPLERVLTALKYQWLYIRKFLLPVDLQAIYSGPSFYRPVEGFFSGEGLVISLAVLALLFLTVSLCLRKNLIGLGLALYLLAVIPTANLFFVSGVTFAERLLYLPSIGACLAVAAVVITCCEKISRPWTIVFLVSCLVFYLSLTLIRNLDYRSAQILWQKDLKSDPQNVIAWMFLANTYADQGQVSRADRAFQEMIKVSPRFEEGLRNYAGFLLEQKRYNEAISVALRVADSDNIYPTNFLVLGQAYVHVGDYTNALFWLNKTPEPYRVYAIYWEYRGRALEGMGDADGAIMCYQRMGMYPKGSDVPLRLGLLLLYGGRPLEAIDVLAEAVKRDPMSASTWNSLGVGYVQVGDIVQARHAFEQATRLAPENLKYRENFMRFGAQ